MSPRAAIARPTDQGWEGVYHHSDGYPEGLGRTLWRLVTDPKSPFHRHVPRLRRVLLEDHNGWSTINGADWSLLPGSTSDRSDRRPRCYCHGDGNEGAWPLSPDGDLGGVEWAYVLHDDALEVIAAGMDGICEPRGRVPWNAPEPDWAQVEAGTYLAPELPLDLVEEAPLLWSDAEALDRIAYMLSAPEWSVSFLEDVAEIVGWTGRLLADDPDVDWPRH